MRRIHLVLIFLALVAFATTASACENCKSWAGQTTCWSGDAVGYDYCYGGWGAPCEYGGYCDERMGMSAPSAPADEVCAEGPLGCASKFGEISPAGFTLERPADVVAPRRVEIAKR
jgi:hypothetical protein